MKRPMTMLLAVLMLAVAALPAAQADSNPSGRIVGGDADVFENNPPLFGEYAIGTIPYGENVAISSYSGDMCYVFYYTGYGGGMLQGWVYSSQVRVVQPTPAPWPTERPTPRPTQRPVPQPTWRPYPPSPVTTQAVVICNGLTLRQEPSVRAASLGTVPNGTVMAVLERQTGWYYISYTDAKTRRAYEGWVSSDYVVLDPVWVTAPSAVACYAIPDRSGMKVGQISKGTELLVICEYGDFIVVNLRSASAFIYKRDIGW